jgi:thioredoxin reductase
MRHDPGIRPLHRAAHERALVETVVALEEHGFSVEVVHDPNAAPEAVLARIPEGSSVMTNTSVTLQETGIADAIHVGGQPARLERLGRRHVIFVAGAQKHLLETSVPGIFAAGDVRSGSTKRCAAAVGEGAMALQFIHAHPRSVCPQ